MVQRNTFVKGYLTQQGSNTDKYLRVEESFNGQYLEIYIGDSDQDDCDCDESNCTVPAEHAIDLSRAQVKELMFCIKQLHFIDKDSK